MGKYTDLFENVYSVFGTPGWIAELITTIPSNFTGTVGNEDYIRVSVVSGDTGVNLKSVGGIIIIDIFVRSGLGPASISTIADKLDSYLVGKTIVVGGGSTQFRNSTLTLSGMDPDNNALFRAKYVVPFNHFGV
jgi:hypothetical protein